MTRAHCRHVCVPRWSVEGDADVGCGQLVAFLFHFRGSLLVFFHFSSTFAWSSRRNVALWHVIYSGV